ncbi:cytochrome b/b6 domain-containing protein [Nitrococcus mobilis]|uniref:Cytochrome b, putative n=1 Tax=Nitrococcus mobilis Nb-231 TaxID=314278 RepID=A4BNI2_9GAMM|nr:cytochrome b/b6 domain-containing protein [Nitrococcus mobilis]EAR22781.1 cytochrome b, putative [Nitrococcus mobilis Nb-231]
MSHDNQVKVWDPVVRVFYWTLVVAFFAAYFITDDDFLWLHSWAGYLILALVALRIIWGFVGTRHARFANFVTEPSESLRYLSEEITGRASRYLGHNPAGAAMVIAILVFLLLATLSGIVLYAADDGTGPLAGWIAKSETLAAPLEDIHELFANLTLALVIVHTGGVLLSSVTHRENLMALMFHGYKRREDAPGSPSAEVQGEDVRGDA